MLLSINRKATNKKKIVIKKKSFNVKQQLVKYLEIFIKKILVFPNNAMKKIKDYLINKFNSKIFI